MSNYGKTKIVKTNTDKRYPTPKDALLDSGFEFKGILQSTNPKDHATLDREIYQDSEGTLWGLISSIYYNYTVQEIILRKFTGTIEKIIPA